MYMCMPVDEVARKIETRATWGAARRIVSRHACHISRIGKVDRTSRRHQTCHFRKRATSEPAEGPTPRTGSVSQGIVNFPSELCGRRSGVFTEVACLVTPDNCNYLQLRPISLLRLSLLRVVDSNFPANSAWTWELRYLRFRFCLSLLHWVKQNRTSLQAAVVRAGALAWRDLHVEIVRGTTCAPPRRQESFSETITVPQRVIRTTTTFHRWLECHF